MDKKSKKPRSNDSMSAKEKPSSAITFDMFFIKCVKEGKLKHWQRNEIAAFFKDMKLTEKEDLKDYEAILTKY